VETHVDWMAKVLACSITPPLLMPTAADLTPPESRRLLEAVDDDVEVAQV
jgi:hypothetical protein